MTSTSTPVRSRMEGISTVSKSMKHTRQESNLNQKSRKQSILRSKERNLTHHSQVKNAQKRDSHMMKYHLECRNESAWLLSASMPI